MIRWQEENGTTGQGDLFAVHAALSAGRVASFPALRPHQREPWHCFLVQTAAMALIRAGQSELPVRAEDWQALLLALTPQWPDGEAWALVGDDWMKPALLQPPLVAPANRADYKGRIATPDALDMLVTSRNHDVKAARMIGARDEDWLFALVTLQTMEGFLGVGNYGISRMNGGFASRMSLGIRPSGGASAAYRRDVARLVEAAAREDWRQGDGLLWTVPWDGTGQLAFDKLDFLYVDVCRRVRLQRGAVGGLQALTAGSKVARVAAAELAGNTGDPWAPIRRKDNASITASQATFGYRRLSELLDNGKTGRPLLALPVETDGAAGLAIVATALVRGQGKTEGLHRRAIPLSASRYAAFCGDIYLDRMGAVAKLRADEAGEVRLRLRRALLALVQGGPDKVRLDDDAGGARIEPWLGNYELIVDREFFDAPFWAEFDKTADPHRSLWRSRLRRAAGEVFERAADAAPRSDTRRIRARAVASNLLHGALNHFVEEAADGA